MHYLRSALGLLAAMLLIAGGAGQAWAGRFSISEQRFRDVFNSVTIREASSSINIECPMTLGGSFHARTFTKVPDQLIAYLEEAQFDRAACRGGIVQILGENLPWHYLYEGFGGVLPAPSTWIASTVGPGLRVTVLGVNCGYRSTSSSPVGFTIGISSRIQTSMRWDETSRIPKSSGSIFCPSNVTLAGTSTTHRTPGGASISQSLI